MPQIMAIDQRHHEGLAKPERGGKPKSMLSASPTAMDAMSAMPRMMSPSPVPLHARLSRIQNEAKKGARILDMDNSGASHHYDYEDVTDSSHDFSSRRHSVAEEDVCYPLQSSNLDIDYNALEEYIRLEQIKTQKLMLSSDQGGIKNSRGPRTKSMSSGLLSKLRGSSLSNSFSSSTPLSSKITQEADYGAIPIKNSGLPERSYSLFGERDRNQTPLDDAYRFTLYSTASVTVHAQTLGEIPPKGQTLSNMLQAGYFWLDVLAPTDDEIRMLSQASEYWINYAIIDDIVDTFAPLIREVETEVDMIDELVLILKESEQADMLRRIGNCRKRVMSLLRLLTGKADVIKGLIKRYEGRMGRKGMGEIGLFMGDIQ
ncbi:CorA metal ion transporter, partial [Dissophora ornata]